MAKRLYRLMLFITALAFTVGLVGKFPSNAAGPTDEQQPLILEQAAQPGGRYGLIATDINDGGFNQLAWEGLQQAAARFGVRIEHLPITPETDFTAIGQSLDSDYSAIIVMGFEESAALQEVSLANPDIPFISIDYPSRTTGDLGVLFSVDEPAFLAGYLAAGTSQTGTVCTYGGRQTPPVIMFMAGFENGVNYYNQVHDTQVQLLGWATDPAVASGGSGTFVGNFTNIEDGINTATTFFDQGCDIIFPVAGAVGLGSAQVAQERGLTVVGVDADQTRTAPQYADVYLTSVMKAIDKVVLEAVRLIEEDEFEGGLDFVGTLANEGVGLAPLHSFAGSVPQELLDDLLDIEAAIINGTIDTGWPIIQTRHTLTGQLTPQMLDNLVYPSEFTASGSAPLVNGEYREAAAPGSATEVIIRTGETTFGDLDGDGVEDAALVLVTNPGGSGTFFDLVAVLDRNGLPEVAATIPLGDRVQVEGLAIIENHIGLKLTDHGPNDPMCCPSQQMLKAYKLQFALAEQEIPPYIGTFTAELPAASSPGIYVTLTLNPDGTVLRTSDYQNGQPPIEEVGTWELNEDGTATVTLTGRLNGITYNQPDVVVYSYDNGLLTAVEYDRSVYGSQGIQLEKQ